jgi:hypothetical protein
MPRPVLSIVHDNGPRQDEGMAAHIITAASGLGTPEMLVATIAPRPQLVQRYPLSPNDGLGDALCALRGYGWEPLGGLLQVEAGYGFVDVVRHRGRP